MYSSVVWSSFSQQNRFMFLLNNAENQFKKENTEAGPATERLQQISFLLSYAFMAMPVHARSGSVIFICRTAPLTVLRWLLP